MSWIGKIGHNIRFILAIIYEISFRKNKMESTIFFAYFHFSYLKKNPILLAVYILFRLFFIVAIIVCPESSDSFYLASLLYKWVTTSWAYCMMFIILPYFAF